MAPDELLARMAATVRTEIAPAVDAAYPRTQAFMASVVLEKVARAVALTPQHAADDERDVRAMLDDVEALLRLDVIDAARAKPDNAALCALVEALYAERDHPSFEQALARVRRMLRASIDRRMEIAR